MIVCLAALAGVKPPGALAASSAPGSAVRAIFAQCASGRLSGGYTSAQLRQALNSMSATVRQYTSCPDVVQAAIFRSQHHRGSVAAITSTGQFVPTPVVAVLGVLIVGAGGLGILAFLRR
ncbi:MAG TPA: hypothetical protein VG325_13200 [Solirubrobacteraceae bacterium]|nr:hypothetical protein [Solirubrobacteraceae bacterium]